MSRWREDPMTGKCAEGASVPVVPPSAAGVADEERHMSLKDQVVGPLRGAGPLRLGLGALGALVIGYGALRLLQDSKDTKPWALAKWLIGFGILHDGVIAPLTVALGWLVARYVHPRARAYVQGALVVAGIVTIMALPLLHRQGKSAPGSALLTQNYTANLAILLAFIAVCTVALYGVRGRGADATTSSTKVRPAIDHEPSG